MSCHTVVRGAVNYGVSLQYLNERGMWCSLHPYTCHSSVNGERLREWVQNMLCVCVFVCGLCKMPPLLLALGFLNNVSITNNNNKDTLIIIYKNLDYYFFFSLCVCVCVCERERERERVWYVHVDFVSKNMVVQLPKMCNVYLDTRQH